MIELFATQLVKDTGGKMTKVNGAWQASNDSSIIWERAYQLESTMQHSELVDKLGLIRTAIWDYCKGLEQQCVHVEIGVNNSEFVRPLNNTYPISKEHNDMNWVPIQPGSEIMDSEKFDSSP